MTLYECLSILLGVAGFGILMWQLNSMNKSLQVAVDALDNARVDTVLQIETVIWNQKQRLEDVSSEVAMLATSLANNPDVNKKAEAQRLQLKLDAAKENYLNPLDRLAYLILKGKISEEDYRPEYRNVIESAVKNYQDAFKGVERRHRNILDLYEKWRST